MPGIVPSLSDKANQKNGVASGPHRYLIYPRSFTSMGVNMGFPNTVTNRWHLTKKA